MLVLSSCLGGCVFKEKGWFQVPSLMRQAGSHLKCGFLKDGSKKTCSNLQQLVNGGEEGERSLCVNYSLWGKVKMNQPPLPCPSPQIFHSLPLIPSRGNTFSCPPLSSACLYKLFFSRLETQNCFISKLTYYSPPSPSPLCNRLCWGRLSPGITY